jgi:transcriptional regulator with XRE-family HTH domain
MSKPETLAVRRKIMGLVLRSTRQARERSVQDCAKLLQLSDEAILQIERGERDLSLPELEALAQFLGYPVADLLSGKMPAKTGGPDLRLPQVRLIRDKIIGLTLRRVRQTQGKTVEEVAAEIGCSPEALDQFERGQVSIPSVQLQSWADYVHLPITDLLQMPPPGVSPAAASSPDPLAHLSGEYREFVQSPGNLSYIKAAMSLSRLQPEALSGVAEALSAARPSEKQ